MALNNLNSELDIIFKLFFEGKNYRTFFKGYSHVFNLNYNDAVAQLQQIEISESFVKSAQKAGTFAGGRTSGLVFSDTEGNATFKEEIEKVAEEFIKEWGKLPNKEFPNFTQTVTKKGKDVVIELVLKDEQEQKIYDVIDNYHTDIAKKTFSKGAGKKLFAELGKFGRNKVGGVESFKSVFDIGHEDAIGGFKGAALKGTIDSLDDVEIISPTIKKVKSVVSQRLKDYNIELKAVDDYVTFKGGRMINNPSGSFRIITNLETAYENQIAAQKPGGVGPDGPLPPGKEFGSARIGKDLGKIRDEIREIVSEELRINREKGGKGWAEREGSDSFLDSIAKGIVLSPAMQKRYASKIAKNATRYRGALKNRNNTSRTKNKKLKTGFKSHNVLKAGLRGIPKKVRNQVESGAGSESNVQKAFMARAFVNSRLTKEVQKNMGRPALENQTGRFAQSVNVVSSVPKGDGIHMDYTYHPFYRVFEGGRQYSPNYDPRPLIENSIRELAAAKLETKFTLRRV